MRALNAVVSSLLLAGSGVANIIKNATEDERLNPGLCITNLPATILLLALMGIVALYSARANYVLKKANQRLREKLFSGYLFARVPHANIEIKDEEEWKDESRLDSRLQKPAWPSDTNCCKNRCGKNSKCCGYTYNEIYHGVVRHLGDYVGNYLAGGVIVVVSMILIAENSKEDDSITSSSDQCVAAKLLSDIGPIVSALLTYATHKRLIELHKEYVETAQKRGISAEEVTEDRDMASFTPTLGG